MHLVDIVLDVLRLLHFDHHAGFIASHSSAFMMQDISKDLETIYSKVKASFPPNSTVISTIIDFFTLAGV